MIRLASLSRGLCTAFAAFTVMAMASESHAATDTANLTVQANILSNCSVGDTTLDFGNLDPANGVLVPVLGTISVTCSLGTSFTVGLGDGSHASSGQRRMHSDDSSDYLNYGLYKNILATQRFGDAVMGERASGLGLGIAATPVLVYGAVPSGQAAGPGGYSDTVLITVYY